MKHHNKSSIKQFNIEEARGWVLDQANRIDYEISKIILRHLKVPKEREHFANTVLLNTSVLPSGGKIKILANIIKNEENNEYKKLIEDLKNLFAIRNGFAHCILQTQIDIKLKKNGEDGSSNVYEIIQVMNSSGQLKSEKYDKYLDDFFTLNDKTKKTLRSFGKLK